MEVIDLLLPFILFLRLPLLMLFVYKSNVGVMFLSACSGLVLLSSLDPVVVVTAGAVVPGEGEAYVRLAVVLLSIVFSGLIFRGTTHGSIVPLHVLIAVILSIVLWLTLPSATGISWLVELVENDYWIDANNFKALFVASGFSLGLIVVLLGQQKHHKKSKH